MNKKDELFVGWSPRAPARDRRFLLGASLGLIAGAGIAGAGFAHRRPAPHPGRWNQGDVQRYRGVLVETPHLTLRSASPEGGPGQQSMLLVGYGKVALPRLGHGPSEVELDASAIVRGSNVILAVADPAAFAAAPRTPASDPTDEADLGPVSLLGEVVDAKCFFGAMNPGVGLTHKACASLCARGGLPLAFCDLDACSSGAGSFRLFLNERGEPHGRAVIPFVADPVLVEGRLWRRNGLTELRVALEGIRRL